MWSWINMIPIKDLPICSKTCLKATMSGAQRGWIKTHYICMYIKFHFGENNPFTGYLGAHFLAKETRCWVVHKNRKNYRGGSSCSSESKEYHQSTRKFLTAGRCENFVLEFSHAHAHTHTLSPKFISVEPETSQGALNLIVPVNRLQIPAISTSRTDCPLVNQRSYGKQPIYRWLTY